MNRVRTFCQHHLIALLLAMTFVYTGVTKLFGDPAMADNFARWGYPGWFMYVAGIIEAVGGVLALLPRYRVYGAALILCTMIGAIATHLVSRELLESIPAVVFLILAGFEVLRNKITR